MNIIRDIRTTHSYSQRGFAGRASLSFRGLQLLEREGHDWRLSSIKKVANALHLPANGIELVLRHLLEQDENSVMVTSIRMKIDGFDLWPLHLFDFVDAFRFAPSASLVRSPPVDELDGKLRCLLSSTVETLCADLQMDIPDWCQGVRGLAEPWFVSGMESLKAMALVESPVRFRQRNIFVLGNFLDRA